MKKIFFLSMVFLFIFQTMSYCESDKSKEWGDKGYVEGYNSGQLDQRYSDNLPVDPNEVWANINFDPMNHGGEDYFPSFKAGWLDGYEDGWYAKPNKVKDIDKIKK